MWPFLPHSLFPPVLRRVLSRPRQAQAEDSCGGSDLGSQLCFGQRREVREELEGGALGGVWDSGVGMGLHSSLEVAGVLCTEDASVVSWAGVHVCERDP